MIVAKLGERVTIRTACERSVDASIVRRSAAIFWLKRKAAGDVATVKMSEPFATSWAKLAEAKASKGLFAPARASITSCTSPAAATPSV
jgi:hypothetical protein